jgi:hypothetical protein
MKRLLLVVAALAAGGVVAPAAHADGETTTGGCFFVASDVRTPATGVIADVSYTRDGAQAPILATVSCWVDVNGVEAANTRVVATGIGAQSGVADIAFELGYNDVVSVCQRVDYASGASTTTCGPATEDIDVLGPVNATLERLFEVMDPFPVDPTICPILIEIHQVHGDYGPVVIGPDGDVSIEDPLGLKRNPVQDCPPYDFDDPGYAKPLRVLVFVPPATTAGG